MKITITPVGVMKTYMERQELTISPGTTPRDLSKILNLPEKLNVMVFKENRQKDLYETFKDNERVFIRSALGGG